MLLRPKSLCIAGLFVLLFATALPAQKKSGFSFGNLNKGGLQLKGFGEPKVAFAATFESEEGSNRGKLHVTAKVPDDLHIYSTTQPKGGPKPTLIRVAEKSGIELLGPFTPEEAPHKKTDDIYPGISIEEHKGAVKWTAPIKFSKPEGVASLKFEVTVDALACGDGPGNKSCTPVVETVAATFKGTYKPAKPTGKFRDEESLVQWTAYLEPAQAKPGDDVTLVLSGKIDTPYHIYKAATVASDDDKNVTLFVASKKGGSKFGKPKTSNKLTVKDGLQYHEGEVKWTVPISIEKTAKKGEYPIELFVGYTECTDKQCLLSRGMQLAGNLVIGDAASKEKQPLAFKAVDFREVIDASDEAGKWVDQLAEVQPIKAKEVLSAMFFGMLGGIILNLMPCVLPVLGLKLMTFAEQAGQNRAQVIRQNLWYTLGILTVFWILASVAIIARTFYGQTFSWGEQFTFIEFKVALIIFVFAMALSFLGTWEIPLPGFASGNKAGAMQEKEGAQGAFAKGVFSTILATPCSGPFLGAVFGFLLTQHNAVILLVFTSIGLGMALPFLLIGFIPALVAWLPKPGNWMETLKQGLAFVLLGTVVWLFSSVSSEYRTAVFGTLVATWFGCWIIGRVPTYESFDKRMKGWAGGVCVALGLSLFMFQLFGPHKDIVPWEPYTEARLAELQTEGKTVMLDFTADWCATCKYNMKFVLDTHDMKDYLQQHDVVAMKADWSDYNMAIKNKLAELESASIPLLVIYPAGKADEPIVMPDVVTKNDVFTSLDAAVKSSAVESTTVALKSPALQ